MNDNMVVEALRYMLAEVEEKLTSVEEENARLKMIVGVEETSMRPRPKFHLGDRVIHQGEQWRIWCVSEFPGKEITYRLYKHDPRWAYVFKPGRNVPDSELIADREVQYELF